MSCFSLSPSMFACHAGNVDAALESLAAEKAAERERILAEISQEIPPYLLSPAESNPKTAKGKELPYHAAIMHLAPADRSGYNTCSHASIACKYACLNTAGHGGIGGDWNAVQRARIRRTRYLFEHTAEFMAMLVKETEALVRGAIKRNRTPALRLNGTSDIRWSQYSCIRNGEVHRNIFSAFPEVTFYDYSKVPSVIGNDIAPNYKITFSLSECNDVHAVKALAAGMNVAAVLRLQDHEPMPDSWSGHKVIDGTLHDYRFLDVQDACIVALRPKGRARRDKSGFVRDVDASLDPTRRVVLAVHKAA
jgi:hypothetical protein